MTSATINPDADVIIIGAGLAGLTAAHTLQRSQSTPTPISTLILEARNRVGGKTWSIPVDDNPDDSAAKIVDVGAAWINDSNQSEVYALARHLGLEAELVVQNTDGSIVMEDLDGGVGVFEVGGVPGVSI